MGWFKNLLCGMGTIMYCGVAFGGLVLAAVATGPIAVAAGVVAGVGVAGTIAGTALTVIVGCD